MAPSSCARSVPSCSACCSAAAPSSDGSSGGWPAPTSSRDGVTATAGSPLLTALLLLLVTVIGVRVDVLISNNDNGLFTSLQELDPAAFWTTIVFFCIVASISVILVLVSIIGQVQVIRWRQWTNGQVLTDWLSGTAYHRGRFVADPIDNPEQRIQADVDSFTDDSRRPSSLGLISSMLGLVSFSLILWGLSGPLTIGRITIPRALIVIVYLFVLVSTVIVDPDRPAPHPVELPLGAPARVVPLLPDQGARQLRGHRALRRGGRRGERADDALLRRDRQRLGAGVPEPQVQRDQPGDQPGRRDPAATSCRRRGSSPSRSRWATCTQSADAFGQVQESLSFFRTTYDTFAAYRATLDRLTGLLDSNDAGPGPARAATLARRGDRGRGPRRLHAQR